MKMTKPPDITGPRGKAWKGVPSPDVLAKWPAGLDTWLCHLPKYHPIWSWYVVTSCSLRDVPGCPPAKKRTPRSTHEVLVLALHPDYEPTDGWCTDTEERWAKHALTPTNLVVQVEDFTDELSNELVFALVRAFANGHASPDDDHRMENHGLVQGTADHLRRGMHVPS